MHRHLLGLSPFVILALCHPAIAQLRNAPLPKGDPAAPRITFNKIPPTTSRPAAPPEPEQPNGDEASPTAVDAAPLFGVVQEVLPRAIKALINVVEIQPESQTRTVVVKVDGVDQQREEDYVVEVPVPRLREVFILRNFGTAIRVGGDSVPLEEAMTRFKKDDVFLCSNSDRVHPAHLQLLKPEGLILLRPIIHVAP